MGKNIIMEKKSTFQHWEKMQINMFKRAFESFKKRYPTIAFDQMVNDAMIENDADTMDDIDSLSWMELNLKMQREINKTFPPKQIEFNQELSDKNKMNWINEIRKTKPKNEFGFGLD